MRRTRLAAGTGTAVLLCAIALSTSAQAATPSPSPSPSSSSALAHAATPGDTTADGKVPTGQLPATGADCNGAQSLTHPSAPAALDLMTASAAQLKQYGFPPRPGGDISSPAVKGWTQAMAHAKVDQSGGSVCIGGTPFGSTTSTNYAGYLETDTAAGQGGTGFDFAESTWVVPSVAGHSYSGCGTGSTMPPDAAVWVGMGQDAIIQTGTVSCSDTTATYRFWTEDYPQAPRYEGPTVHGGDTVYASAQWNGNSTCNYFEEDETTGGYASHTHTDCTHHGEHDADYILESNSPYGIPTFATVRQNYNDASSGSTTYDLIGSKATQETLVACDGSGTVLVSASSVSSSDNGFDLVHHADNPTCQ